MKRAPTGIEILKAKVRACAAGKPLTPGSFPGVTCDTREKTGAYIYADVPMVVAKLDAGDLSVIGAETRIAIDRKQLGDFIGCVTWEKDRFGRMLEKLSKYELGAIVVEASFEDVRQRRYRANVAPSVVIGAAASIVTRYGIPVYFAGNRESSADFTLRLLKSFWRHHMAVAA